MSEIKGSISDSLGMQSISFWIFFIIIIFFGWGKSETKGTQLASQLNLTNAADHTHALRFPDFGYLS